MNLIFFDESGYSKNWAKDFASQPFHVLAGFLINTDSYIQACDKFRNEVNNIGLEKLPQPLGLGFEIKAQEIAKGNGWWKEHNNERNVLRELMLSFPTTYGGTAFLVVIDKSQLLEKYAKPDPPHEIAFTYIFERLQWYLIEHDEYAICVYDQTKFLDDDMHRDSIGLMRDGSSLTYWSQFYESRISSTFQIDRVKEFYLGCSENSLGIQIADYLATFSYQYFKGERPKNCGWWDTLCKGLYKKEGKLEGCGLKIFP